MTIHRIAQVDDLRKMSFVELDRQANILLCGEPNVLDAAMDREIFKRLYVPRNLNKPIIYREPIVPKTMSKSGVIRHCVCEECGRPRHYSSGRRCRYCFTLAVRLKFYDAQAGAIWLEEQSMGGFENGAHCGVQMPLTEWWDSTDMPTYPKLPLRLQWRDKFQWERRR